MATEIDEVTLVRTRTCINCYYQKVEHLKYETPTCRKCFADDKPGNRFPNWKEIKE